MSYTDDTARLEALGRLLAVARSHGLTCDMFGFTDIGSPPKVDAYLYVAGTQRQASEDAARAVLADLGVTVVTATKVGNYSSAEAVPLAGIEVVVEVHATRPAAPDVAPERVTAAYLVLDDHDCPDCLDNSPCGTHADLIAKAIAAADKAGGTR